MPSLIPNHRWRYFLLTCGLTALLLTGFVWINSTYLFHARLYEAGDPGANSLSVLRAERFHELYGAYSRWGFHHPGPALFYACGWAELLLYDALHWCPTPYNAQVAMCLLLACSFVAAGLGVAARWVRSGLFVPLALLLGVLHFTAVQTPNSFSSTWTAFVLVFPFFAMLVAGASVAAGQGDDLPLLVFACSFAVHLHVAQPLFVVPCFVLAYAGLAWSCARRSSPDVAGVPGPAPGAPWKKFPRAHRFALAVLFLFVLSLIVDLGAGSRSNLMRIYNHASERRGVFHPWTQAVSCFLRFGAYHPSVPGAEAVCPDLARPAELGHYLRHHLEMTLLWSAALLLPLLAVWRRLRSAAPSPAQAEAGAAVEQSRGHFLGWLAVFWGLSTALTLYWDHIQEGDMFYFNSWFTYAIYYVLALLAAGAVCDLVQGWTRRRPHPGWWTGGLAAGCGLLAVVFACEHAAQYQEHNYDDEVHRVAARSVDQVLAERPDAPRTKLLLFPHDGWGAATGAAVRLTRLGYPNLVPGDWKFMFGKGNYTDHPLPLLQTQGGQAPRAEAWWIVPASTAREVDPARSHAVNDDYVLIAGGMEIDPAKPGAEIRFVGAQANSSLFVVSGWTPPEVNAPFVYNDETSALLNFSPGEVPPAATVECDCFVEATIHAPNDHAPRHVNVRFNQTDLGRFEVEADHPSVVKITIPGALWNQEHSAFLRMDFAEAKSLHALGLGEDGRPLSVGLSKLSFHLLP